MLNIQRFVCNMFQENCYIVSDETKDCVIIDCGALYDEEKRAIAAYIEHDGLTPRHLIATHGHIDHNYGNGFIYETYGLKPMVHGADEPLMQRLQEQAMAFTGERLGDAMPPVDSFFFADDAISFGHHVLTVMATPGHSPGSVVLRCDDEGVAFSGDTLFRMSIGRTDLMLGSHSDIQASLRTILSALPGSMVVLPGHGPQTTIDDERRMNPYIDIE